MRKNSVKNRKINDEVRRVLAQIISGGIKDPRISPMTSVLAVEVAPDLSSLGSMRSSILSTGVSGPLKRKACLVAEELFVNTVSHAGASKAWFAVEERDTGQLRVTLVDNGTAFDPTQTILPEPELEDLENGGMGIGLVRELSADVRYQRLDGRNILVFQVVD